MKIYTKITLDISTGCITDSESYEYRGPLSLMCGATSAQNEALNTQTSLTNQIIQQGQSVFGDSSQVFNDLKNSLAPTVAAGPSQEGYSAAELSSLNSSAITNEGAAYQNAKAATGDATSAIGGGNISQPSGSLEGLNANLAASASEATASQLSQIQQNDYTQGNQNYNTAISALSGAPQAFGASTSLDNSGAGAASGEANTANQIATQNNSWIQGVTGALGSVAGAAVGDLKPVPSGS